MPNVFRENCHGLIDVPQAPLLWIRRSRDVSNLAEGSGERLKCPGVRPALLGFGRGGSASSGAVSSRAAVTFRTLAKMTPVPMPGAVPCVRWRPGLQGPEEDGHNDLPIRSRSRLTKVPARSGRWVPECHLCCFPQRLLPLGLLPLLRQLCSGSYFLMQLPPHFHELRYRWLASRASGAAGAHRAKARTVIQ